MILLFAGIPGGMSLIYYGYLLGLIIVGLCIFFIWILIFFYPRDPELKDYEGLRWKKR